jgi:hypothetical protein
VEPLARAAPAGMIDHGMDSTQIHLRVFHDDPGDLRPQALRYGMNLRNLQSLKILDAIRRQIFKLG